MDAPIHRASSTPTDAATDWRRAPMVPESRWPDLFTLDPKSPEFAEEARRQGLALANSPTADEDQDFVDAITMWPPD